MISLAPPRNPRSHSARDRRWTIIIAGPGRAEYIELYGTAAADPVGACAAANARLARQLTWAPKGRGFQAIRAGITTTTTGDKQ